MTIERLETAGPPLVFTPALGIVSVAGSLTNETVDMTPTQARHVAERLLAYADLVDMHLERAAE